MIGIMKNRAEEWFKELRGRLISMIENHDQGKFQKKEWKALDLSQKLQKDHVFLREFIFLDLTVCSEVTQFILIEKILE